MDHEDNISVLKKRQEKVLQTILEALKFLKQQHDISNTWRDPANDPAWSDKVDSGLVMRLEALLCFLLPLHSARSVPSFQAEVYRIFKREQIQNEVRACLELILQSNFAFSGEPYITVEDNRGEPHPFVDSAGLALSLILFASRVLDMPEKSDETLFQSVFDAALKVLEGSLIRDDEGSPKGCFFTDISLPDRQYKYCTWMATDSFSDITAIPDIHKRAFFPQSAMLRVDRIDVTLKALVRELHRFYIEAKLTKEEIETLGALASRVCVKDGFVKEDPDDGDFLQFNVWIILALLNLNYDATDENNQKQNLFEALCRARDLAEDVAKLKGGEVTIEFQSDDFKPRARKPIPKNILKDRAGLPQWIKSLAIALKRHADWRESFGPHLSNMISTALENTADKLPVWDKAGGYTIYLTERYIEAFTKYYEYLETLEHEKEEVKVDQTAAVAVDWKALGEGVATAVARNAINIQVGAEGAEALIRRVMAEYLLSADFSSELTARVVVEITTQLKAKSEAMAALNNDLITFQQQLSQTKADYTPKVNVKGVQDIANRTIKKEKT